ncbi:N-acetylmuramoyl-L-alanine amidase [Allohahella marinimesophila]|uniref:N-acetylmuramoyl-L-alanine amidase n=1 Tax=Allohahella marinimesophila TaxID=1054972 RepID=A0ABP7NIN7_9GAMM
MSPFNRHAGRKTHRFERMSNRCLVILFSLVIVSFNAMAAEVENIRIWAGSSASRIVLDLDSSTVHNVFELQKPSRLVIDLANSRLKVDPESLDFTGTPINSLRSAVRSNKDLRIVLELSHTAKARSFVLGPEGEFGHRLVIDIPRAADKVISTATREARAQNTVARQGGLGDSSTTAAALEAPGLEKRDIVVVIDPGHGGKDPGAIGSNRVREKDVVLKISRQLQRLLNDQPGYTAQLTRSDDTFIPLRTRTEIARRHNADILISVHADAFNDRRAHGASVYALSKSGATSETARWLAAKENSSDLIGGTGSVTLGDKDAILAGVLLDLSMTASMKASVHAGGNILKSLGSFAKLHKRSVEQAGFVVLKNPDIPSLLVETGFISNPAESSRLNTPAYQQRIAAAIAKGVHDYFWSTPPPGSLLAYQKNPAAFIAAERARETESMPSGRSGSAQASLTRTIRQGDTLSRIAVETNSSIEELMRLNKLNSSRLLVGQVLQIPSS